MFGKDEKIEFTDQDKELLIECYQCRPILWDFTNPDYSKRDKRAEQMQEIMREMTEATNKQFKEKEVKEVWNRLKTQYNEKKRKAKGETGTGADESATKWKFFAKMATFLDSADVPVNRRSSLLNVKKEIFPAEFANMENYEENVDVITIDGEKMGSSSKMAMPAQWPGSPKPLTPIQRSGSSGNIGGTKRRFASGGRIDEVKALLDATQIEPIAQMVHETAVKVKADSNLLYLQFKRQVVDLLDGFEMEIETKKMKKKEEYELDVQRNEIV